MSTDISAVPLEGDNSGAIAGQHWNVGPDRDPDLTTDGAPRCMATSRQHNRRCERAASPGLAVCRTHGAGSARKAARLRLEQLTAPAIATLAKEMMKEANSSRDKQAAANSILDRAGWGRATRVEAVDAKERLLERLMELREQGVADADEAIEAISGEEDQQAITAQQDEETDE